MYVFSFEKLAAWREARALTKDIYQAIKFFPIEERFGLGQQLRRATISICSNIAEGTSRKSAKDQAHFSTMAYGSLMETLNAVIISYDLGYVDEEYLKKIRMRVQRVSICLSRLRRSQEARG